MTIPFQPRYHPINTLYPHCTLATSPSSPPIFLSPNFLSPPECTALISSGLGHFAPSPVVGSEDVAGIDAPVIDPAAAKAAITSARTSTTIYLDRHDVPTLIAKVQSLANIPSPLQCELPQVAQYLHGQKYDAHYDAFDTTTSNGAR